MMGKLFNSLLEKAIIFRLFRLFLRTSVITTVLIDAYGSIQIIFAFFLSRIH